MALFDKWRKKLIPQEKQRKKEDSMEKQSGSSQAVSPDSGKARGVSQSDKKARADRLTPRERDLYLLLLEGFTLKESAKQLGVQYSTANTHMTSIYKKLGVRSRAELIINYRDIRE